MQIPKRKFGGDQSRDVRWIRLLPKVDIEVEGEIRERGPEPPPPPPETFKRGEGYD